MLIIGDIAGRYKTLLALLAKCPDEEPVSVGDMIDRGPDSKRVLDFFMKHGRAVMGNHELIMLQCFSGRDMAAFQHWMTRNGGAPTLTSFGIDRVPVSEANEKVLDPYLQWVDELPLYINEGELMITHAPIGAVEPDGDMTTRNMEYFVWNREVPFYRENQFQVFGHNSHWGLKKFEDWGMCIDTSRSNILTGLQWPSMKIFQQTTVD